MESEVSAGGAAQLVVPQRARGCAAVLCFLAVRSCKAPPAPSLAAGRRPFNNARSRYAFCRSSTRLLRTCDESSDVPLPLSASVSVYLSVSLSVSLPAPASASAPLSLLTRFESHPQLQTAAPWLADTSPQAAPRWSRTQPSPAAAQTQAAPDA